MITLIFLTLTLAWFFYILIRFAQELIRELKRGRDKKILVVTLHNQADMAEGLVRNLIRKKNSRMPEAELELVDAGSQDETPLILRRLSLRYGLRFRQENSKDDVPGREK